MIPTNAESSAESSFEKISRTRKIKWDLRTITRSDVGVPEGLNYVNYEELDSSFDVEITLLSGKTLRTRSNLVTVLTDGPTGLIESIEVKRSLLPLPEADALLDELVTTWDIEPEGATFWKSERATLGPQRVFPTSEPEMSIQFLNNTSPPTTQTVDYMIFRKAGFGRS